MATRDPDEKSIDVTIAVMGAGGLEVLIALGEKFGLPRRFVERDPSVPLAMVGKDGTKTVFHLSAYESDRTRADAVVIAGELGTESTPEAVDVVRFEGADPMQTMRDATRIAAERIRGKELLPMPHEVREGLHRHDRAAAPALWPDGDPRPGQHVKVQINLREEGGWLAMGGTVRAVLGPDIVEAHVVASTDQAPASFEGAFRARIERRVGWQFPWVLTSLSRTSPRGSSGAAPR